jgi:phosphoenolpyruvate---glycerone phosphotransferase subunit DhaL
MDASTVVAWLNEANTAVKAESSHLTELDSAIGDGDHGINMTRGFAAVNDAIAGAEDGQPPGKLLILAGKTLVGKVGGASGPLYGTALRRAGRSLGDAETFDAQQLATALDDAIAGIVDLGNAEPEDKTMIDALAPAAKALHEKLDAGDDLEAALAAACEAAEKGAEATIPLQARKGRASYLGERSVGHQDPGATSAALLLRALQRAVADTT